MGEGDRGLTRRGADVLVAGGGPAGWAAARACARRGLAVTVVDPHPDRRWRHTYGVWADEVPLAGPDALPPGVVAAQRPVWGLARREHRLGDYAVLDTAALQDALRGDAVRVVRGRVVGVEAEVAGSVGAGAVGVLDDGRRCAAGVVLDATGAAQVLSRPRLLPRSAPLSRSRRRRGSAAEQTALGVVVPAAIAHRVTAGRAILMDWRPIHGRAGWPTFLYAIPLGGDAWLLEETSLARRPGLGRSVLADRLRRRLVASGVDPAAIPLHDRGRVEHVRFPVDTPRHRGPAGVVALGAAAPLVHPATGYSVAQSLAVATRLADVLVTPVDDRGVVDAAGRAVRGVEGRVVHAMRARGLDVLLRLPPEEVPEFFERFFGLPEARRRAYLGAHDDATDSLAAMFAVFGRLSPRLRGRLIAGSLLGAGRDQPASDG